MKFSVNEIEDAGCRVVAECLALGLSVRGAVIIIFLRPPNIRRLSYGSSLDATIMSFSTIPL